jgi:hypothetical protein
MCGGFVSDVLSFETFNTKGIFKKFGDDPERAFIGAADPFSSKVWGKVLGKNYEPIVNQWGGASDDTYEKAEAAGIDTGAGRTMHQVAQTISQFYAMNYASSAAGNIGGGGVTPATGGGTAAMGSADKAALFGNAGYGAGMTGAETTAYGAGGGGGFGSLFSGGGNTSTGQWIKMGGQAIQGVSALASSNANAAALTGDAGSERAAATRQATLVLKNAERVRGAARAATAASGARVDEFSLMNEDEIMQAGEIDAAMAILTGERRARALEESASQQKQAGGMAALTSLFSIGSTFMGGWK